MFALPPLRTLGSPPVAATLRLPGPYLLLAPICDLLDAMSLLSVRQHAAFVATLALLYAAWRWRRGAWRTAAPRELLGGEVPRALAMIAGTIAFYWGGLVLPRPMAALRLLDPDAIAVDFHSHTSASHDGRRGFTVEANRAWHRDAGFDAVFVSDHGTLDGVREGLARNPVRAGQGTTILPALEVRCGAQHVIVLPADASDTTSACSAPRPGRAWRKETSVLLLTIPAPLASLEPLPQVSAIEVADAAPLAIDQMQRDHDALSGIADHLDVAAVAGSNNHGWGRTAAAWSVLEIPGWRALDPAALDAAIRERLHDGRRAAVRVVERRRTNRDGTALRLAATVPTSLWGMLVTLSPAERLSWLVWIWTGWLVIVVARPRTPERRRLS